MVRLCIMSRLIDKVLRQWNPRVSILHRKVSDLMPVLAGEISKTNAPNSRTVLLGNERSFMVEVGSCYLGLSRGRYSSNPEEFFRSSRNVFSSPGRKFLTVTSGIS